MLRAKRNVLSISALLLVLAVSSGRAWSAEPHLQAAETSWRSYQKVSGLRLFSEDTPVFSADGQTLALVDRDAHAIRIYTVRSGELRKTLAVNKKLIAINPGLALSADGSTVAVAGASFHGYFRSNALVVLDVASGKELLTLVNEPGCKKELQSCYPALLALAPDGRRLAWSSEGGFSLFYLWDRDTNQIRQVASPLPHTWGARHLLFAPDGKTLACGVWGAWPGEVGIRECFYDAASGKEIGRTCLTNLWWVQGATFTPDGKNLAVAGEAGDPVNARRSQTIVHVLDGKTFQLLKKHTGHTHTHPDNPLAQGTYVSGSRDAVLWCLSSPREVLLWDRLSDRKDVVLRDVAGCKAVLSPNGRTLAVLHPQQGILSLWRRNASTAAR